MFDPSAFGKMSVFGDLHRPKTLILQLREHIEGTALLRVVFDSGRQSRAYLLDAEDLFSELPAEKGFLQIFAGAPDHFNAWIECCV